VVSGNDKWRVRGGTLMRDNSRTSMMKGIPMKGMTKMFGVILLAVVLLGME